MTSLQRRRYERTFDLLLRVSFRVSGRAFVVSATLSIPPPLSIVTVIGDIWKLKAKVSELIVITICYNIATFSVRPSTVDDGCIVSLRYYY